MTNRLKYIEYRLNWSDIVDKYYIKRFTSYIILRNGVLNERNNPLIFWLNSYITSRRKIVRIYDFVSDLYPIASDVTRRVNFILTAILTYLVDGKPKLNFSYLLTILRFTLKLIPLIIVFYFNLKYIFLYMV